MRKVFFLIFILSAMAACKKNKSSACQLISLKNPSGLVNYEYDTQNRVVRLTTGGTVITLNYFKDSIVYNNGGYSITTYLLNNAGLAVSSKTRPSTNSNFISSESIYSYDNDGYLVHSQEIIQQINNGNIVRDTNIRNFVVQQGNTIKYTQVFHGTMEQNFEYEMREAPANIAFTMKSVYPWSFLGRPSKNLMSAVKDEKGNVIYNASYEFDQKGNVSKKINTAPNNTSLGETQYNYRCD